MTLRVAILGGEPEKVAELVTLLRTAGAEALLLSELPAQPDRATSIVLIDQALLTRQGPELLDRVREHYPAALLCLLALFAHRSPGKDLLSSGLWDALYLPAQQDEVDDLLSRTEAFVERRENADRSKRILVVDDEESIREVSAALLERLGFSAETAADALEAVGKLHAKPFDLVVSDLQMPGMDGVALLERIRAAYPLLPVIIATGHATVETAIDALRTGATDFIRKPFKAEDFIQVVERALRFGELSQTNSELEAQARLEKTRLRERQYELRVLAAAISEMSRAVQPAQVAECWLRAASQTMDFTCGAFLLGRPDPELVLLQMCEKCQSTQELLALLAEHAPTLVAGISPEGLRVRYVAHSAGPAPPDCTPGTGAQVHLLGPATNPCAAVALFQPREAAGAEIPTPFIHSLTTPAAQVLEKLRALAGESRLREAAMVAGMHQGVILTDLEGRVLVMNAAARTMLSLHRAADAAHLTHLASERDFPMVAYIEEMLRSGADTLSREFLLRRPAERVLTLDLSVIRGETQEAISVVGLLRDITEQREAERMKSEFVTIVSHELRTPLTTIKNCNSLLLSGSTGEITPQQRRFLQMAQVSIDRITRLVSDLLDVARIDAGRLILNRAPVDLTELLREVGHEIENLVQEKQMLLEYRGLDAPLTIWADRERLKQVFFNLVHNAVKFSESGGRVELRAAPRSGPEDCPAAVRDALPPPGTPLVEVQVIDEGVGISPEDLEHVFDRFYQVEHSLHREFGGIGLGLPISRGIVRSHGGEIWAERREEGGSVFRVLLPRDRDEKDNAIDQTTEGVG